MKQNALEPSLVGPAVSACKPCVQSSKNHDPARKCDRLFTALYLKHDQIYIIILNISIFLPSLKRACAPLKVALPCSRKVHLQA